MIYKNDVPRPEYPRPSLVRTLWQNLNGEWEYEKDNALSGKDRHLEKAISLSGQITVPYAPESDLSGIGDTDFIRAVWYRRTFEVTEEGRGMRVLLHFGAVDYETEVWVNGLPVGSHRGGYTPFVFDITSQTRQTGENVITVFAKDDPQSPLQPSGKQSDQYLPSGCMYPRVTGIWQTVWIEYVPEIYITELKITPDVDNERVLFSVTLNREYKGEVRVYACFAGEGTAATTAVISGKSVQFPMTIRHPILWAPGSPNLYTADFNVAEDHVATYFGMRKIRTRGQKIEINNIPVFQRLVLDQGYYPDGLYTAPDDESIKNDILLAMEAGFNGARMHMKIFEPRYLYWADKLGYLLWGEFPDWGLDMTRPEGLSVFLPEWVEFLRRDYNSPALIGWCPFNEIELPDPEPIYKAVRAVTRLYDPYRPLIDASGHRHTADTDIFDSHNYEQDPGKFTACYEPMAFSDSDKCIFKDFPDDGPYCGQPYMVSEFGGITWAPGEDRGWGYGTPPATEEEFYTRYDGLVNTLLCHPSICGFCYTQLTDVFQEKNGIYFFDRGKKFDTSIIRASNTRPAFIEIDNDRKEE